MGLYRDEKTVVDYINKKPGVIFTYDRSIEIIASQTKLDEQTARRAIELAIDSGFLNRPKHKNGDYIPDAQLTVTEEGKRFLERPFGVTDQFIGSYRSAGHLLSIIAIIISITAIIVSFW